MEKHLTHFPLHSILIRKTVSRFETKLFRVRDFQSLDDSTCFQKDGKIFGAYLWKINFWK